MVRLSSQRTAVVPSQLLAPRGSRRLGQHMVSMMLPILRKASA